MKLTTQDFVNENVGSSDFIERVFPIQFKDGETRDISMFLEGNIYKNQAALDQLSDFLDHLPDYNEVFKAALLQSFLDGEDNTVQYYLEFHLEEIPLDKLAEALPEIPPDLINGETILKNIKFTHISIHFNQEKQDYYIMVDYRIAEHLSDELLVIYSTLDGKVITISHES